MTSRSNRRRIGESQKGREIVPLKNDASETPPNQIVRPTMFITDMRRIHTLVEMLSYKRPHGSMTEQEFIRKYIMPCGAKPDSFGNYHLRIGEAPILWSAHTDTVHRHEGLQHILVGKNQVAKVDHERSFTSTCLGADDTTGIWIMLEMINAEIPGLYIFHRGEECGGLGSSWIVGNTPHVLKGIKVACAFDRRGYGDVITSQGGDTASRYFATKFSDLLGDWWEPSAGVYTDTAEYAHLIPECTNLSVGYYNQHTDTEWQDLLFASWLRDKMVTLSVHEIISYVRRKPSGGPRGAWGMYSDRDNESIYGNYYKNLYGGTSTSTKSYTTGYAYSGSSKLIIDEDGKRLYGKADMINYEEEDDEDYWKKRDNGGDDVDAYRRYVENFPRATVELLLEHGIGIDELKEYIRVAFGVNSIWD